MSTSPRRTIVLALLGLGLLLAAAPPARARLDNKTWREVEQKAKALFGTVGRREAKAEVVARLVEDGQRRAWRLLVDGVVKEAKAWVDVTRAVSKKDEAIADIEGKPMVKRYPEEQKNLEAWKVERTKLDAQAAEQRRALADITQAVAEGPEALRKNLLQRAKGPADWTVRAAAVRVAAFHFDEKPSYKYLRAALESDPDPRVRLAALEALHDLSPKKGLDEGQKEGSRADLTTTVESLILGRLADKDWGVQVLAVRIIVDRDMRRAVPHLINALVFAGPRVREAIGQVLRDMTGENFDPYADVWSKWWDEHHEE
ncbi:MAG: HEAT repeat domain-containing protein, partial [Planctomycetota bacterium]